MLKAQNSIRIIWPLCLNLALCCGTLIAFGCNRAPTATKRIPSNADIVGTWQYHSIHPKALITIRFNPDETFQQQVVPGNGLPNLIQEGNWKLDMQSLLVQSPLVRSIYGKWVAMESVWIIIDSTQNPRKLSIFGGVIPDPDAYEEFTPVKNNPIHPQDDSAIITPPTTLPTTHGTG